MTKPLIARALRAHDTPDADGNMCLDIICQWDNRPLLRDWFWRRLQGVPLAGTTEPVHCRVDWDTLSEFEDAVVNQELYPLWVFLFPDRVARQMKDDLRFIDYARIVMRAGGTVFIW